MASVTGGHFLYGLRLVFAEFAENLLQNCCRIEKVYIPLQCQKRRHCPVV